MTKTELKEIMLKIQNECALEEPSKITYFWNENGKVVFKFYFDSLYLPDDLNLSDEKRSERIKNLFTNQNVYEFQDDFNIIELNTEEGWIKVIPTDQNFKVVDSYKDLKKKKEDDEKEESVTLAGKRLNENVALAEGMILREDDEAQVPEREMSQEKRAQAAATGTKNKDSTKKKTTVLKGKSIFICTVGNPFGENIKILSNAFENNKGQTSFDTLIVIPAYGKEFGIAKGGDFGFKESVREALRKKIFDQNWGLNIFSLEHQESREILKQSSENDGDDVLFFCAKSQKQEIQSILSNDYKINLQNFFDIEEDDKKVKVDNKKEDQKNDQSEDNKKEDQSEEGKEEKKDEEDADKNLIEELKKLPAVLSADYIEGKENIATTIVEAFMADVEKIKNQAEEDSKNPKKNNDKSQEKNDTQNAKNKNGDAQNSTDQGTKQNNQSAEGGQADGKGTATGTTGTTGGSTNASASKSEESIFLSPYRIHRKLVEKKQSEAYKLETNADWDYYFNKLLGEKWVTAKKEYTKSYQSRPQNVDSEEFKTYFYLGMIAYAYATSNKVLELDKPYIKNEKSMEQQLIDNPKPKKQSETPRGREPGSEDLKLNLEIGFGTDEQKNTSGNGGLIVNSNANGGSGQVKTKNIKTPDLSVKTGKDNITSNEKEAPKSFPGAALPFNLKIWALVDNQNINEDALEKLKTAKIEKKPTKK